MSTRVPTQRRVHDPAVLKRMMIAFDLCEAAEQMQRQNLRRKNPQATEEEIEEGVLRWLYHRPGNRTFDP